jgi:hypothetical protein
MGPQIVSVEPVPQPLKPPRKKPDNRSSVLGWVVGGKPKASTKKYVESVPAPTPDPYYHPSPYPPEENRPKHKHKYTSRSEHRASSSYTSYFFAPAQMMWLPKSVTFRWVPLLGGVAS